MNTPSSIETDVKRHITLLTDDRRAGRLHFNLRYLLANLPEPDYRSGMPAHYPAELAEDIDILLRLLDIVANSNVPPNGLTPAIDAADDLREMIRFLVASIRPQKIFLLPHPPLPNDGPPFMELIIIMPDSLQKSYSSLEQVIDLGLIQSHHVHSTILRTSDLSRKITGGDLYYCTVCSRQHMVYDDGRIALPQTTLSLLRTMMDKAMAVFTTGYAKAAGFLEGARLQPQSSVAAFMLQQVAELTYRTTTLALTGYDPRSHSFDVLRKHVRRCAPELNSILPADTANDEKMLHLLESAYLSARYNDSFRIEPEILELLTGRVTYLHKRSKDIFEHQLQALFKDSTDSAS